MTGLELNLLVCASAVALYFAAVMAASIRLRNHSLIDIFWGPGFVLVATVSFLLSAHSGADGPRRVSVLALTTIWGLRLAGYIGRRNAGHGQDPRYTALLRRRTGNLIGFLVRTIYGPQAAVLFVVSLPVQAAMYQSAPLGPLGALGIGLWCLGFGFEAVGDAQLAGFRRDPANAGKVMDRGLWAWTRHPNYFGDSCVWVGLWLLAVGDPVRHPLSLITVVSPVLMTYFLVKVTGKALLEKGLRHTRGAAYAEYAERTSGFLPRPPRRRRRDNA